MSILYIFVCGIIGVSIYATIIRLPKMTSWFVNYPSSWIESLEKVNLLSRELCLFLRELYSHDARIVRLRGRIPQLGGVKRKKTHRICVLSDELCDFFLFVASETSIFIPNI